jgi:hypothetical protein
MKEENKDKENKETHFMLPLNLHTEAIDNDISIK